MCHHCNRGDDYRTECMHQNLAQATNLGIPYVIDITVTGEGKSNHKGMGHYPSGFEYDTYWKTRRAFSIVAAVTATACCFALDAACSLMCIK